MVQKSIKICHVANSDKAVKFLLLPQLEFLKSQGFDVCVVCSFSKWKKEIENCGIKIKDIKITRKITQFRDLLSLLQLFFYFKKEKFSVVHTHTPKAGLLGQLAAKAAGVPVVINTIHGIYSHNKFFILIEKIAAKCSDIIFSQNKEDIETLKKENIANEEKIKYLGNGVDLKKFNCKNFSAEFLFKKRKELGIYEDFLAVGIVARLVKEKGYLELFKALKRVLEIFPKTVLLVAGSLEPEKKDALDPREAEKCGIGANVKFLGERTDLDQIFPLMDIFVLPSYREGLPRSVLEAMAEERPIVATNIRGCKEEIDNGIN